VPVSPRPTSVMSTRSIVSVSLASVPIWSWMDPVPAESLSSSMPLKSVESAIRSISEIRPWNSRSIAARSPVFSVPLAA